MKITDLQTPAFLVAGDIVARNCATMRKKAAASSVAFRPHVKTHKTMEVALMQHGGLPGPITVSTLAEAEFFAKGGFEDIVYAVPVAPAKLERCAALVHSLNRFAILVDSLDALGAVEEFARAQDLLFDVWLKIDCGYHRAGVDPESDLAMELGRRAAASRFIRFLGALTHGGHSYHARRREEIVRVAADETKAVSRFVERMREAGVDGLVRSVGSTPTMSVVDRFEGCDEVRPGNYVFYDAFQATIGACRPEDVAVSVLATVIGVYPEQRKLLIDAGALAMSKDRGPEHVDPEFGFGIVCGIDLRPLPLTLTSLSQEHGQVYATEPHDVTRWPVGTKLRIIPNHSCLTAALYDRYDVVDAMDVIDAWRPVRGW